MRKELFGAAPVSDLRDLPLEEGFVHFCFCKDVHLKTLL